MITEEQKKAIAAAETAAKDNPANFELYVQ